MRRAAVSHEAGYDGEFGTVNVFTEEVRERFQGALLFEDLDP